jgi:hypothetical protein
MLVCPVTVSLPRVNGGPLIECIHIQGTGKITQACIHETCTTHALLLSGHEARCLSRLSDEAGGKCDPATSLQVMIDDSEIMLPRVT